MKQKELEKLIQVNTDESGQINLEKITEAINMDLNRLLEKNMPDTDALKAEWEKEFTSNFYKELNLESIDSADKLREFVEARKDLSPEQIKELKSQQDRLAKELEIHKLGFAGDADDLDYIITRASKLLESDEELQFTDAVKAIKENKPYVFGEIETNMTTEQKQTAIKTEQAQPISTPDRLTQILKERYSHYNPEK
jgi:hypothetical protein